MRTGKDIFENIGKDRPSVPEGYFDDLKARLNSIPVESATAHPGSWSRVRPYLALAASFAAIVLIGNAILKDTTKSQSADQFYGENSYADIVSITNPEIFYNVEEFDVEDISDDDIINYLIETGVRAEHLAYAGDQY
ncbi:MAG: hypothetical protein K6F06_08640 [Bacteroidales bacterium]|nr:hypothetical protein [Bacteroidales bacterium]